MLAAITTALALVLAGPAAAPSEPVDTAAGGAEDTDAKVEDAKVEPPKVEDAKVEDAKVEDAKVEPPKVEDAKVEPPKVEPPPPRPVEPYKPKTMPGQGRGARVGFVIAGSIVLAGGLALAGTMGWAIAQSQKYERDGERLVGDDPMHANRDELDRIVHDGRRMNRTAVWTGVAAGVAISTAIGVLVSASRPRNRTVAPALSRGGAGLVWSVRF